jgi:hypothetical protein
MTIKVRNKILMPGTQLPAESFRADIRWELKKIKHPEIDVF